MIHNEEKKNQKIYELFVCELEMTYKKHNVSIAPDCRVIRRISILYSRVTKYNKLYAPVGLNILKYRCFANKIAFDLKN